MKLYLRHESCWENNFHAQGAVLVGLTGKACHAKVCIYHVRFSNRSTLEEVGEEGRLPALALRMVWFLFLFQICPCCFHNRSISLEWPAYKKFKGYLLFEVMWRIHAPISICICTAYFFFYWCIFIIFNYYLNVIFYDKKNNYAIKNVCKFTQ